MWTAERSRIDRESITFHRQVLPLGSLGVVWQMRNHKRAHSQDQSILDCVLKDEWPRLIAIVKLRHEYYSVWIYRNRCTYIRHHLFLGFGRSFSKSHFRRTTSIINHINISCRPLSLETSSARILTARKVSQDGSPSVTTILSNSLRLVDPNGFQASSSGDKRPGIARRGMVSTSSVSVRFACYNEYQTGKLDSVSVINQRVERKQGAVLREFKLESLVINCRGR